ncbi:MAG: ferritin-like domain-containing protein [Gaiellaceae bacterium]
MTSPKELFVHELQDMYYAEKTLTKVLPKLASEASDSELSKAFKHHLEETQGHVENLEQVFRQLGKRAEAQVCPGIEGIKEEHESFMKENEPSTKLRDVFITGSAARAEHYEIAAYTGLVGKAKALGESESAKLLEENLRQEKDALKKVETISRRIMKETSKAEKTTATRAAKPRSRRRATASTR